ncbi:MAG: hypothetical protein A2593_01495 [Candidatus Moranbacteria bacterium RIFOXYD1_FULL_44_9]|nr:MAG: hypothetical protein A2593_01495 [Candidatus Moranbacteria bacterium RIFOXYD1_FULL_44_9]
MFELLEDITEGRGTQLTITKLETLANTIKKASLCGLGQTAPNPVLSTMKYFKHEYEEHINNKKCRAKVCRELLTFEIVADKCVGCSLCARNCPVFCIHGEPKTPFVIDQKACIKCGSCVEKCNFDAITVS